MAFFILVNTRHELLGLDFEENRPQCIGVKALQLRSSWMFRYFSKGLWWKVSRGATSTKRWGCQTKVNDDRIVFLTLRALLGLYHHVSWLQITMNKSNCVEESNSYKEPFEEVPPLNI